MVDISHDDAVGTLKSTNERVVLRIEKNAISNTQALSGDEEEVIIHCAYHCSHLVHVHVCTISYQ